MATYTDDFERASLGANWTQRAGTPQIYGSSDLGGGSVGDNVARWAGTAIGNDQSSQITIATFADGDAGVAVRINASGSLTQYVLSSDGSGFELGKLVAGSYTTLASAGTPPSAGDTIKITASGTTIKAFKNGVEVASVTDSSIASGQPGVTFYHGSIVPTARVEAWEGADLGGGDVFGACSITASGAMVVAGRLVLAGAVAIAATGTLSAVGRCDRNASCSITASGTLAAKAVTVYAGRAVITTAGTLTPSAVVTYAGQVAITGSGSLTARGSVGGSLLLATLKGAGDYGDGSDTTKSCVTSGLIFSPPIYSEDLPALTCDAIDNSSDLGPIGYVVLRARIRETNPTSGPDHALLVNQAIRVVQDHPTSIEDFFAATTIFPKGAWEWVETPPLTLALDGAAWDWARVNSLRALGAWGQWYCDIDPGGPTTAELCLSEVEVLVYGPGGGEIFGEVAIAASGTLTAAGRMVFAGQASMAAQGTLSANGTMLLSGVASIVGAGSLAASGAVLGEAVPVAAVPREPLSEYFKAEMRARTGIDFNRRSRG